MAYTSKLLLVPESGAGTGSVELLSILCMLVGSSGPAPTSEAVAANSGALGGEIEKARSLKGDPFLESSLADDLSTATCFAN